MMITLQTGSLVLSSGRRNKFMDCVSQFLILLDTQSTSQDLYVSNKAQVYLSRNNTHRLPYR